MTVVDTDVQPVDGFDGGLVNQMLGQAQAFRMVGDLVRTFGVSKLAFVKENKLYQQLRGTKTPNGGIYAGTWVEFCGLVGVSDDKANEDIANLHAFGEEALENMRRVGIGYRELRQFRRLPADDNQALIEAAATGDKETLLDLAETIIARHTKEKEILAERVEGVMADHTDVESRLDTVTAERDGALKRLNKRNQRDEDEGGVPLVMADLRSEIAALVKKAELAIDSFTPLGVELMGYRGHEEAGVWVEPTGRLAIAGLMALRLLADGAVKRYAEALDLDYAAFEGKPEALAFLAPEEILAVAQEWPALTAVHGHEAALRQHEREQARPKGKGRPAKAPEAPKAKA